MPDIILDFNLKKNKTKPNTSPPPQKNQQTP